MTSVVFTPYGKTIPHTLVKFSVGPCTAPVRDPPVTNSGNGAALVPVADIVMAPGPLVMATFVPAVRVVSTGVFPVEPTRICPLVGAAVEATLDEFEK